MRFSEIVPETHYSIPVGDNVIFAGITVWFTILTRVVVIGFVWSPIVKCGQTFLGAV
jgi:hypothetical protein